MKAFLLKVRQWLWMPRDLLCCRMAGVHYDASWRFYGLPKFYKHSKATIQIGKRLHAVSGPRYNPLGVFQPVIFTARVPGAQLVIGDDFAVSGSTIAAAQSIKIGNYVTIGAGVLITDCDWHPLLPQERRKDASPASKPVVIEDDVFIGSRAIVLKGVTIGRGAVVGAGAVVVKNVPEFCVVAGNPACVIKQLFVTQNLGPE